MNCAAKLGKNKILYLSNNFLILKLHLICKNVSTRVDVAIFIRLCSAVICNILCCCKNFDSGQNADLIHSELGSSDLPMELSMMKTKPISSATFHITDAKSAMTHSREQLFETASLSARQNE